MTLTYQQLLIDLYQAYYSAKKHKSNRSYVKKWEKDLKQNMEDLCNDLFYRTYISNHSLRRMEKNIEEMDFSKPRRVVRSINSYLGVLGHYASYNIIKRLLFINEILRIGVFDDSLTKFTDGRLYVQQLKSKKDGKGIW